MTIIRDLKRSWFSLKKQLKWHFQQFLKLLFGLKLEKVG